jgi:hypothetical protein
MHLYATYFIIIILNSSVIKQIYTMCEQKSIT